MMNLTTEQRNAIGKGEAVTVEIDGKPCVLILKGVYEEQARKILDFSKMQPGEAFLNIDEVWGEDPALDLYQEFKR